MGLYVSRETADVVDHNDEAMRGRVLLEISEHRLHAEAGRYAAGYCFIDENPVYVIALHAGEFTAAGFLRSQALASGNLCRRRHARIDDGVRISRLDSGVPGHDLTIDDFAPGWHECPLDCENDPQSRVRTFSYGVVL